MEEAAETGSLKATSASATGPSHAGIRGWTRVLVESALIVFSILLALAVNEMRDGLRLNDQRQRALTNIREEVEHNLAALESALPYHTDVAESLGAMLASPGANADGTGFAAVVRAAPMGLNPPDIRRTAWETAVSTDAVARFDYELTYRLGGLYDAQAIGVEATIRRAIDLIMSTALFDPAQSEPATRLMLMLSRELVAQESTLAGHYRSSLAALDSLGIPTIR